MASILIVDDEAKLGHLLVEMLESPEHQVTRVTSGKEALAQIAAGDVDLVISDLRMPEVDGMAVLRETRRRSPGTDVIVMTAYASAQGAVDAMKEGAADYLIKPFAADELRLRVGRLLERRQLSARADQLARRLDAREGFGRIVAESAKMRTAIDQAQRVAATEETVLLLGESGTGKSLLARAIHHGSRRAAGPFVEVHSAALPETLLESELFGRDKGAFTGATESKRGHVEAASGGTLFLDEIGELPLAMQVKLLRFLQERTFVRLGSTEQRRADVRVIAATNRDLQVAVKEGRFREDLYYRLAVFPLVVPPLRERPEDIRATALQLLARRGLGADRLRPDALAALAQHAWPGNVRELENALSRALVLAGTDPIGPEHLPAAARPGGQGPSASVLDDLLVPGFQLDAFERDLVHQAIVKAGGNKAQAARLLGVTRRRMYSLLESSRKIDRGPGEGGEPGDD
jgi:two-component system response regulator HydG